ncbi:MAG: hypothetical protein M1286_00825 [Candidatus Marsarchaeota archaeon]|nr:hypothetical protein [Candidatus Marsarchaeota archaeon]
MADQPLTTSIDDLVKYVNEHGETDSTTLASALKVGENIIETWADVLEKAQIVKINYKLGKMFVSPKTITKEGAEVAKKTVEMKRGVAETELATQVSMINQINTKLDEFKRYVSSAEGAFKTKAGQIKENLDQIDKLSSQVDSAYRKLKEKKDTIDRLSATLDKEAAALEEKAGKAQSVTGADSDPQRVINDISAKLEDSESRLKALRSNVNSTMEQSRNEFSQLLNGIKDENKALREMLSQREKELHDYESFLKSYGQQSDSVKRQAAKERTKMIDDIANATEDTRRVYSVAEKQITDVKKSLSDMKSQFGGFADLSDKLNGIKSSIDSISRQKDELLKEIEQLQEQTRALSVVEDSKVAEKSVKMRQVDEKMTSTKKKVSQLDMQTDEIKKGIDDMAK